MTIYINKREIELAKKLKIGDKVKIKSLKELSKFYIFGEDDLNTKKYKLYCGFSDEMLNYVGKKFRIIDINNSEPETQLYGPCIKVEGNIYTWTASMLDFSEEKSIKKYSLE